MKKILITGASRGIGRSIAVKLANDETTLFLHGRDKIKLAETEKMVKARGADVKIINADLVAQAEVEELAELIEREKINVLINNAGIAKVGVVEEILIDDWNETLAVNVTAPFLLTKSFLKVAKKGDSVVNILSVAVRQVFTEWSSYSMSKAALDSFSKVVRAEARSRGIRVINIYPASTNTDIWDEIDGDFDRPTMIKSDEVGEAVAFALTRPDSVLVDDIWLSATDRS